MAVERLAPSLANPFTTMARCHGFHGFDHLKICSLSTGSITHTQSENRTYSCKELSWGNGFCDSLFEYIQKQVMVKIEACICIDLGIEHQETAGWTVAVAIAQHS